MELWSWQASLNPASLNLAGLWHYYHTGFILSACWASSMAPCGYNESTYTTTAFHAQVAVSRSHPLCMPLSPDSGVQPTSIFCTNMHSKVGDLQIYANCFNHLNIQLTPLINTGGVLIIWLCTYYILSRAREAGSPLNPSPERRQGTPLDPLAR